MFACEMAVTPAPIAISARHNSYASASLCKLGALGEAEGVEDFTTTEISRSVKSHRTTIRSIRVNTPSAVGSVTERSPVL